MIQLCVPVFYGEDTFGYVDLKEPSPAVLADTQKEIEKSGNYFKAMHTFLSGSIEAYHGTKTVETVQEIKVITRHMPYTAASAIALDVIADISEDDRFEGVYTCPRCGKKITCELAGDDDTRDSISDLPRSYMPEGVQKEFGIDFVKPAILKKGKEEEEVISASFHYPTLQDCEKAHSKIPQSDSVRRQYQIYAEAMERVNGEEKPDAWKANFGMYVLQNVSVKDIHKIGREVGKYGVDNRVEKICPECSKVFKAEVNTANFFASALQSSTMYL